MSSFTCVSYTSSLYLLYSLLYDIVLYFCASVGHTNSTLFSLDVLLWHCVLVALIDLPRAFGVLMLLLNK